MKYIYIYCFLLLACLSANAQNVQVSVSLDSTAILIGDQTNLHLTATVAPNQAVQFPQVTAQQLGDLEILKTGKIDTITTNGQTTFRQDITVTAFDSGFYRIPELPFRIANRTFNSRPIELAVSTMQIDSTFIVPIKPIMGVPFSLREILGTVGGIMVFIAALIALLFWLRKRQKNQIVEETPPYVPPAHVTALQQLKALEGKQLWQQNQIKAYYTQLTYIFREYLGNRYRINALESTTDEIIGWLKKENFSADLTAKLRDTLQASDLVKFAKSQPDSQVHQNALKNAYTFINATQAILTPEEEAELEAYHKNTLND